MATETLEFTIYPDGRVVETVKGVRGKQCTELTAEIEGKLGNMTHRQETDEHYQTVENQSAQQQWESWGET
ncbi:DUF2997 domain-containing protein [Synechococcus sp. PCC 7336]|uniref:DUF2997 domain-containing protein n=1 Tax=Synechococcus sp. PCC 7336 TaxID=195250 RepID=UPI00034828E5|nr:DUF2997 domain-containing protein [Synechococcus sp. PCC 7336]